MRIFFTLLLLFIATIIFSQDKQKKIHPIDAECIKCLDKPENQTTLGMINCNQKAKKAWEAEMNKYYQLLMKQLSAEQKTKLTSAQDAWVKYKTQEFSFSSDLYLGMGGTMWKIVATDNQKEIVKERTLLLKSYYESLTEKY